MRTIEMKMNEAIKSRRPANLGNTTVSKNNRYIYVRLHGNLIAVVCREFVYISSAGWETVTTKSRLNAILDGLGLEYSICQKRGAWYLCHGGNVVEWCGAEKILL